MVCGFDCASDVKKMALAHRSLKTCSVQYGELSWTVLYDEREWEMTAMLEVMQVIPESHACVERCCAHCCMQKKNSVKSFAEFNRDVAIAIKRNILFLLGF